MIVFILIFFQLLGFGTEAISTPVKTEKCEQLYIHLNNNYYVSGDVLKFKLYFKSFTDSEHQQTIVYFNLIDALGKSIKFWKTDVDNGIADGSVQLPHIRRNEICTLIAYTSNMRNFNNLFLKRILVLSAHPDQLDFVYMQKNMNGNFQKQETESNDILVVTEKENYMAGSSINVLIKLPDKRGDYPRTWSVSIAEVSDSIIKDDILKPGEGESVFVKNNNGDQCDYPVERYNYVVKGFVTANGHPIMNNEVVITTSDTILRLTGTFTDENGKFLIQPDKEWESHKMILSLTSISDVNSAIEWSIDEKKLNFPHVETDSMPVPDEIKPFLKKIKQISLVNSVYSQIKPVEKDANKHVNRFHFFGIPDYVIYPEEYEPLNNFKEIADNLLPTVRYRRRIDRPAFYSLDPNLRNYFDKQMLLLVNGVPTTNALHIDTLQSSHIHKIEIVNSMIFYGDLTFHGFISIETFRKEFPKENTYTISVPVEMVAETPAFDSEQKLPDFKTVIYWDSMLQLEKFIVNKLTVSPSLNAGTYKIICSGLSDEGIIYKGSANFTIKESYE